MAVLTVNAGSSSLKVSLFDLTDLTNPRASFALENIGADETPNLGVAVQRVRSWLQNDLSLNVSDVTHVGYRVVHGGPHYSNPTLLDESVIESLTQLIPLAPNHMPGTLEALHVFRSAYPNAAHVACFDTGFFANVPDVAKTLPLPQSLQTDTTLKRYGFHGLAYQGLLESFATHEGESARHGRVIMAHLGSGASLTACRNGKPVEMTMGFTPVSGIMMSTRSGDIEPGVFTYLHTKLGLSIEEINDLLTNQSGLLGVSGLTHDMYELLQAQETNPNAALAISLFCYQITKTIGAYTAALGGVDSIIFSGGIGERSAEIRQRVLDNLSFLGIELNEHRNTQNERLISSEHSSVGVHVIPAREDTTIASQTISATEHKENQ